MGKTLVNTWKMYNTNDGIESSQAFSKVAYLLGQILQNALRIFRGNGKHWLILQGINDHHRSLHTILIEVRKRSCHKCHPQHSSIAALTKGQSTYLLDAEVIQRDIFKDTIYNVKSIIWVFSIFMGLWWCQHFKTLLSPCKGRCVK